MGVFNIVLEKGAYKIKRFSDKSKIGWIISTTQPPSHPTTHRTTGDTCPENPDLHQQKQNRIPIPGSRSRKTRNAPLQSCAPAIPITPHGAPYHCSRFCYWFSAGTPRRPAPPFQARFLENCVKLTTQFSNRMPGVLHIAVFRLQVGENAALLSGLWAGKSQSESARERARESVGKCRSFAGMPQKIITVQ